MNLIALNPASLILGQPLPFALRGTDGSLLAHKGYVLRRDEIDGLLGRGVQLCVDIEESEESHRAYLAQLQQMLISDQPLGEIASMKIDGAAHPQAGRARQGPVQLVGLQFDADRAAGAQRFAERAQTVLDGRQRGVEAGVGTALRRVAHGRISAGPCPALLARWRSACRRSPRR